MYIFGGNKDFNFKFKNPIVKLVESFSSEVYLQLKYLKIELNVNNFITNFYFSSCDKQNLNKTNSFLHLKIFDMIHIYESYKITNPEELLHAESIFKSVGKFNGWEIIIPLEYLENLYIDNFFAENYDKDDNYREWFNNVLISNKISWTIYFLKSMKYIDKVFSFLPPKTIYSIKYSCISISKDQFDDLSALPEIDWNDKKFSSIIIYKILTDEEYEYIYKILSANKMKRFLKKVILTIRNLSEWLKIVNACTEWSNLESIRLQYKVEDLEDKDSLIEEVERWFTAIFISFSKYYRNIL